MVDLPAKEAMEVPVVIAVLGRERKEIRAERALAGRPGLRVNQAAFFERK